MLILLFKLLPTMSLLVGEECGAGSFAITDLHSPWSDTGGHREMTKLSFTLRLSGGQGTVGGSFWWPKSHLRPCSVLCYLSLVARRISFLRFSQPPLFSPYLFDFPAMSSSLLLLRPPHHREWMTMCFPVTGVTGIRWVLSPPPLCLFAFLDGAGGLRWARPSQQKSISLAFYSKRSSVLLFTTCCLLIDWG